MLFLILEENGNRLMLLQELNMRKLNGGCSYFKKCSLSIILWGEFASECSLNIQVGLQKKKKKKKKAFVFQCTRIREAIDFVDFVGGVLDRHFHHGATLSERVV